MKKALLLIALAAFVIGCESEPFQDDITADRIVSDPGGVGSGGNGNGDVELYNDDLMAGQHIDSGGISVTLVDGEVIVTYETEGDWVITETHLYVGPLEDLPTNGGGNPRIGHFPYGDEYDPAITTIDYSTIELAPGDCVYVAAHAVVENTVTGQEETAWGNGVPIGGNNWSMMFEICAPAE